ncbi:hypothetical protein CEN49_20785, partial [Fischerella thermalis CCMEE 5273]
MSVWQLINLILFIGAVGYAFYLFARVVYARYTYVKLGKPADFSTDMKARLHEVWVQVFGQKKLLKDKKSGIMHVVMFYGFIIIQFGAIDLFIKGLAPGSHLPLPAYPAFTFIQELTVFAVLLATAYAFYRRYVEKLARLKRGWKAGLVILFLTSLMFSILMSATFEQLWLGIEPSWALPISSLLALPFTWM